MTIQPFSPDEANEAHQHSIPEEVIDEVNKLLTKVFYNPKHSVIIYQDDLLVALLARGIGERQIFDNHWLDFELLYTKRGWTVKYDKPDYNGSGRAYWEFKKTQ